MSQVLVPCGAGPVDLPAIWPSVLSHLQVRAAAPIPANTQYLVVPLRGSYLCTGQAPYPFGGRDLMTLLHDRHTRIEIHMVGCGPVPVVLPLVVHSSLCSQLVGFTCLKHACPLRGLYLGDRPALCPFRGSEPMTRSPTRPVYWHLCCLQHSLHHPYTMAEHTLPPPLAYGLLLKFLCVLVCHPASCSGKSQAPIRGGPFVLEVLVLVGQFWLVDPVRLVLVPCSLEPSHLSNTRGPSSNHYCVGELAGSLLVLGI